MAKTKGKVLEAAKQLQQLAPAEPAAKPKPDAPTTRVHGKGGKAKKPEMAETSGPQDGPPDFDITWANFGLIKKHFDLSDKETTDVLLKVVGPDTSGSDFWKQYQLRVKEEIKNHSASSKGLAPEVVSAPEVGVDCAVAPKRRRLSPLNDDHILPDNQLGDPSIVEGTEFSNSAFYDVDMDDVEGEEEEEELEMDPDEEDIEVPATTGRGDDPDSPSPGAVAVAETAPTVVCEAPPPQEPVRTPVLTEDPAKDAKES